MSAVKIGFYLIIGQYFKDSGFTDGKPSVRVVKTLPRCDPHEIPIWINVALPESLFKRPRLQASIQVPESQAPITITPEVQQNIAQVVQEQLGIHLQISSGPGTPAQAATDKE